ncbi:MAG: hypothetical protein M3547_01445 [Acidobacteriota bacterium]|nr:hypothetical protein [Acidobacteriota bacterium]
MAQRSWAGLTVLTAALVLPHAASAQPERVARPSTLLTLGGLYTVQAGWCDRSNRSFRVFSQRPIDVGKVQAGQIVSGVFIRERDRVGTAGWLNVTIAPDGLSVEFELHAEGGGNVEMVPGEGRKCVAPKPGRVVVDVEAWVVDP